MAARQSIDADRLSTGFDHLVVSPPMLNQLGPAVNSGKALFLYGAPGNGKTVVAEGIGRALGADMYVPHAIDVDGQVITMFDPVNHVKSEADVEHLSVIANSSRDQRWEKIRRPVVVVGGELTLEMLDLSFNPIAKFYEAPIQLKANGGVFVVDDFGRQRIPPRDLLNRWIVPLESRIDFLTLHTGRKFELPFNVFIIFATNLKPESLADEAFLRRIPYKILAKDPTLDEYCRIFELVCRKRGLPFDPVMVEYLDRRYYQPRRLAKRSCHPARPDRPGDRHLPLPEEAAAHHPRPARHGVQQLFHRGDPVAGERDPRRLIGTPAPQPRSAAIVAPRCERGSSPNRSTSGWRSSACWTMPRCTPMPRPWTSRTSRKPAACAAVMYSSTTDGMSRGGKACRSSSASIGTRTGSGSSSFIRRV